MLDKLQSISNKVRDSIAQKVINFMINRFSSDEYGLSLQVLVAIGLEQLRARRPINYIQEHDRLYAMGLIHDDYKVAKAKTKEEEEKNENSIDEGTAN